MALPDFLLDPCSALLVFYLISRSLDWHVQQITFRQKNFKRFEDFRRRFWQYSRAYVGFDRVNHSNSIFITTENHHVGEIFTLAPVFFSLAAQCSHFLHSRIATAMPVSHPLARLIHTLTSGRKKAAIGWEPVYDIFVLHFSKANHWEPGPMLSSARYEYLVLSL